MSKIAIVVNDLGGNAIGAIAGIRKITGLPLTEIKKLVGADRPMIDVQLFKNDHSSAARKLRDLISVLEINSVDYNLYELVLGEEYDHSRKSNYFALDAEKLENILISHDKELKRQQKMMFGEANEP